MYLAHELPLTFNFQTNTAWICFKVLSLHICNSLRQQWKTWLPSFLIYFFIYLIQEYTESSFKLLTHFTVKIKTTNQYSIFVYSCLCSGYMVKMLWIKSLGLVFLLSDRSFLSLKSVYKRTGTVYSTTVARVLLTVEVPFTWKQILTFCTK